MTGLDLKKPGEIASVDRKGNPQGGAEWVKKFDEVNLKSGQPNLAYVAGPKGQYLGAAFTCEEWPPASTIEGDSINSDVACAPQNAACAMNEAQKIAWNRYLVRTEQNFQANAQSRLATVVQAKGTKDSKKAWRYCQYTTYEDVGGPDPKASWIDYRQGSQSFYPNPSRRDLDYLELGDLSDTTHVYQITEHHYINGSYSKHYSLFKRMKRDDDTDLDHIHTYRGELEWFKNVSDPQYERRSDDVPSDPNEAVNFNACMLEGSRMHSTFIGMMKMSMIRSLAYAAAAAESGH